VDLRDHGKWISVRAPLKIASNVLIGNDQAGLAVVGSDGVQIYNNTLYGNQDVRDPGGDLFGAELVVSDAQRPGCEGPPDPLTGCVERWRLRNVVIRNNLIGRVGSPNAFVEVKKFGSSSLRTGSS
jgi:parallel beta-helix repeat protein